MDVSIPFGFRCGDAQRRMTLPYRTGSTWLTDDDLILLDTMFDCGMPLWALRRDRFRETLNYSYTHGYDDETLVARLEFLVDRGVLAADWGFRDFDYVRMAPAGGALWSEERRPVWDRYCEARGKRIHPDRPDPLIDRIIVRSPSREMCERYLEAWTPADSRRRIVEARRRPLLWWRSFERLYAGVACYPMAPRPATREERVEESRRWRRQRDAVEEIRIWWGDVGELQKFVQADP